MGAFLKRVTSPTMYWLFLFHFLYLFQIHANESMGGFYFNAQGILLILLSFVPVALLFYLVNFLFNRSKKALILGNLGLFFMYGLGAAYHFHARVQFEWDLLKDNLANAFYFESLIFMWNSLEKEAFNYVLVFALILLFMEWKYKSISRFQATVSGWRPMAVVVGLYLVCMVSTMPCYDPLSAFFRSIYVYYFKSMIHVNYEPGGYPLQTSGDGNFNSFVPSKQSSPHIFLIIVESLNQSVIGKKTKEGKEITPFLNHLATQSLVVQNFYANSIQSARGYVSIYFSLLPSITDKITTQYADLTTYSLADALNDNGYESVIFHAHDFTGMDNKKQFFGTRGFDMKTVKPYVKPEDKPYVWRSWGPEDRVFFKRFFDYYDQGGFSDKPMFFSFVTVTSHVPFSIVPEHRRLLHKVPKDIHEEYANSIHLVDRGIALFFDELKARGLDQNSIVIVTADHTIPMGEHGIYHQEAGYYEESFRIPLFIHWPDQIKPKVIAGPYSQMDLAPTILDMIDAKVGAHHFMGKSIFSKAMDPVVLIQPYGKHLSIVYWPYKFIWHGKTGKIEAFHLADDPMESRDVYAQVLPSQKERFKADLANIYLIQKLYQHDEVYQNKSVAR